MGELDELKADLEEFENYQDEEEDESISGDLYSISSFGVDYTVELVASKLDKKQFYIPEFQREFVWNQKQSSRFIESLLLGLPVPGIFLFKEADTGKHLVIDGQQRLRSVQYFRNGLFHNRKFVLSGLESQWAGLSFEDLDEPDRARLDDAVIHATVFQQDLPMGGMDSVYEVFERINTGGMKLSPQEIRSCMFHGKFNELLHKLNENESWREIFGKKNNRLKDVEFILRFLAFNYDYDSYQKPLKKFLNDFMEKYRNADDEKLKEFKTEFEVTIGKMYSSVGIRSFRPERSLNAAVFDSAMTGLSLSLDEDDMEEDEVSERYKQLLENAEYREAVSSRTSDEDVVKKRLEIALSTFGAE